MMLGPRYTSGSSATQTTNGWHLQIPPGPAGNYRLSQLDNYSNLKRRVFPLITPASLEIHCRNSSGSIPGTWGFGFWNDPFAFSLGLNATTHRLPVLPNSCWFFNASPENHLSFQENLPGNGFLAQTFKSPRIPAVLLLPGLLSLPFLFLRRISKLFRRTAGMIIGESCQAIEVDTTLWHTYKIFWMENEVIFQIDDSVVHRTSVSPRGPLGVVIWIDNQFAEWKPSGKIGMGTLAQSTSTWIDVENIRLQNS